MPLQQPTAVRFFAPDHPALNLTVRNRIEAQRADLIRQLGEGAATGWDDYNKRYGVIRGLTIAIELCEEVEKQLTERKA